MTPTIPNIQLSKYSKITQIVPLYTIIRTLCALNAIQYALLTH